MKYAVFSLVIWLLCAHGLQAQTPSPVDEARPINSKTPVNELIERLAHVRSVGPFQTDPCIAALVRRGDAAVEPLLECLVHDDRMTEAKAPSFNASRPPVIYPVHRAALDALERICEHSFSPIAYGKNGFYRDSMPGREQFAAAIRAYWQKYRGVPIPGRCYDTLRDDQALEGEWLQAAEYLARRRNVINGLDADRAMLANPAEQDALRGESLRTKSDPTVGSLLARRMNDLAALPDDRQARHLDDAARIAEALLTWNDPDGPANVRRFCNLMVVRDAGGEEPLNVPVLQVISLYRRLIKTGHPEIREDYPRWLRETAPMRVIHSVREWFQPLWEDPELPANKATVNYLFTDEHSPWVAFMPRALRSNWLYTLIPSPMLEQQGFREWVCSTLADRSRAGRVTYSKVNKRWVQPDDAPSGVTRRDEPFDPKTESQPARIFRACDYVADHLSTVKGMSKTTLDDPEPKRDEAIAACLKMLRRDGEHYRFPGKIPPDD